MKLGICGTGQISEQLMRNAAKIKDIQVVSVMHREMEKAKRFAHETNIPFAFDSMKDFLNSDIDTVYVGLPNSLHFEVAEACIRANKHVLVEKPFTSNLNELNQLIRLANQHKVLLLEVNRVVYLPNIKWIKQNLSFLGPLKQAEISYCKRSRKYNDYQNGLRPNVFTPEYSGGALMDLGVYGLHLACELFGMPKTLTYRCEKLETGVDAEGILTLDYGEWRVLIHQSKVTNGDVNVKIQGEQAVMAFDYAPSILKQGKLMIESEIKESDVHEEENFYYFLKKACEIIDTNDRQEVQRLMQKSIQIMTLLDEARAQCGIVFSQDMEVHS